MALVTFGGGVAQMRGRLGGTVFSHNRGGNYARNFVKPTNPGTDFQLAVREIVAFLVNKWINILTQLERDGWNTYAANVAMTNKVGDTIYLTGQQHFIRANTPRKQAADLQLPDAPVIFDLGTYTQPSMALVGGASKDIAITFGAGDAWANSDTGLATVSVSREQNPTINYFVGPYRFADSIDGDSAVPPVSPITIATAFTFAQGNKCFAQLRFLQGDGRMSTPVRIFGIAS